MHGPSDECCASAGPGVGRKVTQLLHFIPGATGSGAGRGGGGETRDLMLRGLVRAFTLKAVVEKGSPLFLSAEPSSWAAGQRFL